MNLTRRRFVASATGMALTRSVIAAPRSDPKLDQAASSALRQLIANNPAARQLNDRAMAVLVFPKIVKAGFLVGGAYGEGALRQGGKTLAYYRSAAGSYGLQAGVQWFGYALFFMNTEALNYLDSSQGFEIGAGPSVVVMDQGAAKKFSSSTVTQDIYAFIFSQKGLMAGLGIEGSKITKIQ